MPTRKALDKILKGQGVTVQHVMEFDNIETVKRAVELDCGVAIVPEATIQQEVADEPWRRCRLKAITSGHWARFTARPKCCPRPSSSSLPCSKSQFERHGNASRQPPLL